MLMMVSHNSRVQIPISKMCNSNNRRCKLPIKINSRMTWSQTCQIYTLQVVSIQEIIGLQLSMLWTCKTIIKHNSNNNNSSNKTCLCLCSSNNSLNSSSKSSSPWRCSNNNNNKWCNKCRCSNNSHSSPCLAIWTIMVCSSLRFNSHRASHRQTKCKTIQCKQPSLEHRIPIKLTSRVPWKMTDRLNLWIQGLILSRMQTQTRTIILTSNYTEV